MTLTPENNNNSIKMAWDLQLDLQLISFVNQLWETNAIDSLSLTPSCICIPQTKQARETWPLLSSRSLSEIRMRFGLLCLFNQCVSESFPLIDLTDTNDSFNLGSKLLSLRHLIFFDNKLDILQKVLKKTAVDQESVTIYLSRLTARAQNLNEDEIFTPPSGGSPTPYAPNVSSSLFLQAMAQLHNLEPSILRQKDRSFKVILKGEHAEGEVGPYRESITEICTDIRKQLLIPCPNQRLAKETIGVGDNRDKFIIDPTATNPQHLNQFRFFGKLIGVAIRSKNPLSLDLPSVFWKPLVGQNLSRQDLKDIDYSTSTSLERIEQMDENTFSENISCFWTTLLSDGRTNVELIEGGSEIMVTYETRKEFVEKCYQARLNEANKQMNAIKDGLETIVPLCILKLFTWQEIQYLVCGRPEVDLSLLKVSKKFEKCTRFYNTTKVLINLKRKMKQK